ncbi:hypothetical protein [Streptomyces olivaceiscleroticus]|uniref:hypothetical protein n=1 Tax=Streptomyces olivaceiscleroticus TaxID=68245 RepID=UPI0031F88D8E
MRVDTECRMDRLAGRPRMVPAGPAAEHLRKLLSTLSGQQVARAAGVHPTVITRVASGERRMVQRGTAEKILAVPVTVRVTKGVVPTFGASRRVRALYALGYMYQDIAQAIGSTPDCVADLAQGRRPGVSVHLDEAVRRVYDAWSMRVPPYSREMVRTRNRAAKQGWVPPLAWDDDAIDDPRGVPVLDVERPAAETAKNAAARFLMGESVVLSHVARREAVVHLMQWTELSFAEIAERVDSTPSAVETSWERAKKKARESGQPVPWRRVVQQSYGAGAARTQEMGMVA